MPEKVQAFDQDQMGIEAEVEGEANGEEATAIPTSTRPSSGVMVSRQESRRSFALNVTNGALFNFSNTLIDPNVVLIWFLSRLTDANILLGLLGPISTGGWFLPQLFLSSWVQQKPRKIVVYRLAMGIRLATWAILVLAMWFVRDPLWLLLVFYPAYTVMSISGGLGGIPFLEIVAKTIPVRWRGRLFALRLLTGGILGLLGSRLVSWGLDARPYPQNYALLVLWAMIAGGAAMVAVAVMPEPPGKTRPATPLREQVRRGWQILREDADYRNFVAARSLLLLSMSALPFYSVMARRELGAPENAVGDFLLVLTLMQLLVNYPWGWLVDTKGRRWVSQAACVGWLVVGGLALLLLGLAGEGQWRIGALPAYVLAYPLFGLVGAVRPAEGIAGHNLLLEISPEEDRPLYVGFANTFFGVVVLLSGLIGGLVDLFGLEAVFALAMATNALAFIIYGRIRGQI